MTENRVVPLFALVLINLLLLGKTTGKAINYASCTDLGVSITVSSLVETATPRQLELSWWNAAPEGSDYIGLYTSDPSGGAAVLPLVTLPVSGASGYGLTEVEAPVTVSTSLGFTGRCLEYWVAYVRNRDNILATSCLRTQPTWMSDMRDMLGDMQLRDMFLPGTHDAAAYKNYTEGGIAAKQSITQEEDILSQLVHGIRYLDMRVAYYRDTEELWWTNHGVVRLSPLKDILVQVKEFIDNTEEIVIFDIHEITNFGDTYEIHNEFVSWLTSELDGYMAPSALTWYASLNDIWSSRQRLVVTYNDQKMVDASDKLWRNVQHRWGNVRHLDELYEYLQGVMANSPQLDKAWSAMAELTATPQDVVTGALGGLRVMADSVNRNVSVWFRGTWGESVNIVASDFFRGTTIVQESIDWNKRRASGASC